MTKLVLSVLLSTCMASAALAATVTNSGSSTVVLQVVEDGSRVELAVDAGETESFCPSGCFVTLPSGDRVGLEGGETIEIKDGAATVK
ncbi:hypothetical protein [Ciceribacter sp. RN22]|uniref:hypothetical protein n=1 Tax=Ciceribacter sp. RN22 TaxID=2954932 RepID=UPI0020931433|nr:hypothetical protein [Ciceribacter sp. RN22]MCO6178645.1 hypothetical protein [Ciceribacter sp. RN22]